MRETRLRGVVKALTYRFWQSLNTFVISFVITGSIEMAAAIVSIEVVLKLIIYYFHERIWDKLSWGKNLD